MRLFPFILCLTGSLNHKQILDFFVPLNLGAIFIPHRGTDLYPKAKCHYLTSFLKIWIRAWPLKVRLGPGSWITYSWKSQMFLKCLKHLLPNPKWIHFSLKYFLSLFFFFCKYLGCFDTQMFSQTFPPASHWNFSTDPNQWESLQGKYEKQLDENPARNPGFTGHKQMWILLQYLWLL